MERRILATTHTRDGCALRLIEYAAGVRQRPHRHDRGSITLILRGALVEGSESGREAGAALSVVAKPAGLEHENVFGESGATTLQIEMPAGSACFGADSKSAPAATWDHAGRASRQLLQLVEIARRGTPRESPAADDLIRAALEGLPRRDPGAGAPPAWLARARGVGGRCDSRGSARSPGRGSSGLPRSPVPGAVRHVARRLAPSLAAAPRRACAA